MISDHVNKPDIRESFELDDVFSEDDGFSDLIDGYGFSMCGAGRLAKKVRDYRKTLEFIDNTFDGSFEVDELMSEYLGGVSYDIGRELENDVSELEVDQMAEQFYEQLRGVGTEESYSPVEGNWIELNQKVYGMSKNEVTVLFKESVGLALQDQLEDSDDYTPQLE